MFTTRGSSLLFRLHSCIQAWQSRGIRLCWGLVQERPRPGLAPPALTPELPAACPAAAHLGSHRDLEGSPLPSMRVVGFPWGVVLGTRVRSPAPVLGQLLGGGRGVGAGCSPSPGLRWGHKGAGPFRPGHAAILPSVLPTCPAICLLFSPSWSLAETALR